MTDWERARQAGHRVFFEPATGTLRQSPENYLLATRSPHRLRHGKPRRLWAPTPDRASTINGHSLGIVLDQHWHLDGEELAVAVDEAFFGPRAVRGEVRIGGASPSRATSSPAPPGASDTPGWVPHHHHTRETDR